MTSTTHDEAAEYLRLALPLMSRYRVPVTPPNYAVWYEYVAGTHEALRRALDERMAKDEPITEEVIQNLYDAHVALPTAKKLAQAREALRAVLEQLGGSMDEADGEVSRYQASLAGFSARLREAPDGAELRRAIEHLVEETRSVRETGHLLQERLDQSRMETEALRRELEQLRQEATTDALTGLANRKAFQHAFETLAGHSGERHLCLLLVDIDRFKSINDNYGHLVGDKVLRYIANVMRDCIKGKDFVARYGGEEFAVLLPDTPYPGAMAVAENLRRAIEGGRLVRLDTREHIGSVTVSVGVAHYRTNEPFNDFIGRADEALYRSKKAGRNRVSGEEDPVSARTA